MSDMSRFSLIQDLQVSLGDAADSFKAANDGDFGRHLDCAAADFSRVQRHIRTSQLTLVPGQAAYAAPADLVSLHIVTWGKAERQRYQPWEDLHPGRLPTAHVISAAGGKEIHLSPAPNATQIGIAGSAFDFYYTAPHLIDKDAANTTVLGSNRDLLLLRAQAEAMKELSLRGAVKPVQLHKGMGSMPASGTPQALHDSLMKAFAAGATR